MTRRSQAGDTLSAAAALAIAYGRMRVREFRVLLSNPLALVFAAVAASGYIWVLITQGDLVANDPSSTQPYVVGFILGLCLIAVALTAQRGSPLRLQPADISWALQSRQGPPTVLLVHSLGSSLLAFFGATVTATTALGLRGEPPIFGPISGLVVMSILLALRATSLGAHLVGKSRSKRTRTVGIVTLLGASLIWFVSFFSHFSGLGENLGVLNAVADIGASPFRAIVEPELGDLRISVAILALAALALSAVVARADIFVEPSVHESILANKLQKVLSGGKTAPMQGQGYKTGLRSWSRWPESPMAAVLNAHLAQARRRRLQDICTAVVLNIMVLAPIFLDTYVPGASGLVIALLVLTLSSPSQPTATELDHQHLVLANVSLAKIGFAGIFLNALVDLLACAPGAIIGLSLYLGSPFWGILYLVPLAIYMVGSSLAGVGARALSDAPLGRSFVSLVLGAVPLLVAISSVLSYGEEHAPIRLWLTITGTMLVSVVIYAGITLAVFVSARPASRVEAQANVI